jgi:non-ribosomal peptide synthetase-like protein
MAYTMPHYAWVIATDIVWRYNGYNDLPFILNSLFFWTGTEKDTSEYLPFAAESADQLGELVRKETKIEELDYMLLATLWVGAFMLGNIALLLFTVVMKWAIIGRYEEANHPFLSRFHFRWSIMMNFKGAMAPLSEHLQGTAFQAWYYRIMGATVGKNCYLAGLALEYDLLHLGDGVAINEDCDTTAHTVERMVLKMAPVRAQRCSSLQAGAVVMPGGVMEEGALLLEHSQVLKGDTVPADEVWGGLPARKVGVFSARGCF